MSIKKQKTTTFAKKLAFVIFTHKSHKNEIQSRDRCHASQRTP